jgi:drug/metabolite transporter (DMT)-like permease
MHQNPRAAPSEASLSKAVLWMGGWLALMVTIAVAGREAAGELDVFQVMLVRSIIGFALLYPLVHKAGGFAAMRTARPLQHIGRNLVHYAAQYGWFLALTLIPLAQVVALEFTMPIWTAILAVAFLGENMNVWKKCAVALGLAGVAIIVRPGMSAVDFGQVVALLAAVGFAVSVTMVKSLTRTEEVTVIIFWMLIIQSAIGLVPALLVWRWPPAEIWSWLVLIAFCGTFSHYCMARAMVHADATVVVPMDFLRVPLTAVAGWLVYSETLDALTVTGTMVILFGNLLNLKRSARA